MNVSLPFLLGLGVAIASDELVPWLPGEATLSGLALAALATPLPWLWARATGRALLTAANHGRAPGRSLRLAVQLQPWTVPLAFLSWTALGGYLELIERLVPDAHVLRFAGALAPLVAMETSQRLVERRTLAELEARRSDSASGIGPPVGGMNRLFVVTVLAFGLALDAVGLDRHLEVFFHGTAIGATSGALAMVLGLSAVLPLVLRFVLPTSRALPDAVAGDVWDAASQLGFAPRRVLSLHTDLRVVNAALVGPLHWPRYLILTDGILAYLDRIALRGVVAHEVGHARAGHPGLLLVVFGIVPLLAFHPLQQLDLTDTDPLLLVAVGAAIAVAGIGVVRALLHRFEFEADQLSATALGGAMPCIMALRRVGDLFPSHRTRTSFRHPSEDRRVRALAAWDTDPEYRVAFLRRGRVLRAAILAVLGGTLAASAWTHFQTSSLDVATLRFFTGDFAGAATALANVAPDLEPERTKRLRQELTAAQELVPAGGEWRTILPVLADRAWERGVRVADTSGIAAARPYFALALGPVEDPLRTSVWLWADAAADGDAERAAQLARHVTRFAQLPPELRHLATTG